MEAVAELEEGMGWRLTTLGVDLGETVAEMRCMCRMRELGVLVAQPVVQRRCRIRQAAEPTIVRIL